MSRIGKAPITVPAKVEVTFGAEKITVKGPLGTLTQATSNHVTFKQEGATITLAAANDSQEANAMSGTMRALIANMVKGVDKGFERKLLLVGVGYKAQAQGDKLNLTLGYSHPVVHAFRHVVNHGVGVTERQVQLVALRLRFITHTNQH